MVGVELRPRLRCIERRTARSPSNCVCGALSWVAMLRDPHDYLCMSRARRAADGPLPALKYFLLRALSHAGLSSCEEAFVCRRAVIKSRPRPSSRPPEPPASVCLLSNPSNRMTYIAEEKGP